MVTSVTLDHPPAFTSKKIQQSLVKDGLQQAGRASVAWQTWACAFCTQTLRFESTAKVVTKRMLKFCRIMHTQQPQSCQAPEHSGTIESMHMTCVRIQPKPLYLLAVNCNSKFDISVCSNTLLFKNIPMKFQDDKILVI